MPAEILADEGVNFRIVRKLREAGIKVTSAAENFPGATDREVLDHAARNKRLLLTEDRDYGELVFAHKLTSTGVLFLRYSRSEENDIVDSIRRILETHGPALWSAFTVVTATKVRIRPLP